MSDPFIDRLLSELEGRREEREQHESERQRVIAAFWAPFWADFKAALGRKVDDWNARVINKAALKIVHQPENVIEIRERDSDWSLVYLTLGDRHQNALRFSFDCDEHGGYARITGYSNGFSLVGDRHRDPEETANSLLQPVFVRAHARATERS
jgi:hypothetical protein